MTEFKKGDKIRCIDDSRSALLIKDKIYTFNSYTTDDRINIDEIDTFHYPVYNFELITEAEKKFKAGDKIRCINDWGYAHIETNKTYTFISDSIDKENYICIKEVEFEYPILWFELVEQNPVAVKPKIIYRVPRLIQIEDEQV